MHYFTSTLILPLLLCLSSQCEDTELAEALAQAGTKKSEKHLLYRALVYDASCGTALYALGLIALRENDKPLATSLLGQACSSPTLSADKKLDALRQLQKLEPLAGRLPGILEEYGKNIAFTQQKYPESSDLALEAAARLRALKRLGFVPENKIPPLPKVLTDYVVGSYWYTGPWWTSAFEIRKDKTFIRTPDMVSGKWYLDEKTNTLHIIHIDNTHDILPATDTGYANARVSVVRKKEGK